MALSFLSVLLKGCQLPLLRYILNRILWRKDLHTCLYKFIFILRCFRAEPGWNQHLLALAVGELGGAEGSAVLLSWKLEGLGPLCSGA